MREIILLIGIPGSGKTRLSYLLKNKLDAIIISSDDIREEKFGSIFDANIKDEVYNMLIIQSLNACKSNKTVIIDTTLLNEKQKRVKFVNFLRKKFKNITIRAIVLDTDIRICNLRDKKRNKDRQVGDKIIRLLKMKLSIPSKNEKLDEISIKNSGLSDKEFRNSEILLPNGFKIHTRGCNIDSNRYKPDISIVDSNNKIKIIIESSSSGDRKSILAELLQAEKFSTENNFYITLLMCLSGKSKTSPTPQTQKDYLAPYFKFLCSLRKNKSLGVQEIMLISEMDYIDIIIKNNEMLLNQNFIKKCEKIS
jgi:predicted kinase